MQRLRATRQTLGEAPVFKLPSCSLLFFFSVVLFLPLFLLLVVSSPVFLCVCLFGWRGEVGATGVAASTGLEEDDDEGVVSGQNFLSTSVSFLLCYPFFSPCFSLGLLPFSLSLLPIVVFSPLCSLESLYSFSVPSFLLFFLPLFVTFSGFYKARGWPLLTFMCSCLTIVRHERLKETGDCSTWPLKKDNGQLRRRSWETWFRTVLVSCWIGPWSGEGDEQWFKTAPFVSWKWLFFTLVPKRFKLNNWDLNQ